jgi:hypothetical protein
MHADQPISAEEQRLVEARQGVPWREWGPYLSERQWGTVREDYSDNGDAWSYFSHDEARSRAYRWGEDGIAGISDDQQRMCFAIALWNERDPIIKERLFGLTNAEGNHGEDVKEYYFYVDNLPSHAYQRLLYKYPQREYPYSDLVSTNARRSRYEMEYELIDTGVFDDDHYFDVEIEYAKSAPDDIVCVVTVHNRGPEAAPIHVLPTLWFRNTWSWEPFDPKPSLVLDPGGTAIAAGHRQLGQWYLHLPPDTEVLFCDNETNAARLWAGSNSSQYPKDAINDAVVSARPELVSASGPGTKASARVRVVVPGRSSTVVRARLNRTPPDATIDQFADVDVLLEQRRAEADEFYATITPPRATPDEALVMRQALAGMLWSKQTYSYDVDQWLRERGRHPLRSTGGRGSRNDSWFHMANHDVISMPDKWEYPWFAAWDLAFHAVPLMMVDPDFAKQQLALMLTPRYLHPSGQIPAYEWNFGDVNPPVHAAATLLLHTHAVTRSHREAIDVEFLKESYDRLRTNYTWWVNRKDPTGRGLFEGGFLGLDNIGVFDRSAALPTGGRLEQADGTAWMAMFSQNMLELALLLTEHDPSYEADVLEFFERFFWIAAAVDPIGDHADELWDEEEGFFYDVLRMPDGSGQRLKVRSVVGLLPICATAVIEADALERFPHLRERAARFLDRNSDLVGNIPDPRLPGVDGRRLLSLVDATKLRRILTRMLDEERFLGPHGIRSLSRWHLDHPYEFEVHGERYVVQYTPAESTSGMFGGNSNWRGPVWFPINVLIVRALLQHYRYYGDDFTIECPTGSGQLMTLFEVAQELSRRLVATFLRDPSGRRPVYGGTAKFQNDPHWRDLILFYEYYHGDNGSGVGASHQTGWSGIVARLIQLFGEIDAESARGDAGRPMARGATR